MTSRERVGLCLRHQRPDRVPIHEDFWEATANRWRNEGLPAEVSAEDYFGLEFSLTSVDNSFGYPHQVIERTDEYIVERDSWGDLTKNWLDHRSTPALLDFSIKTRAQWNKEKKRLAPDPARVNWDWVKAQHARWREKGQFVCISAIPGYEATWRKIGPEALLTAIADDPEWVMEMYEYDANMIIGMVKLHLERGFEYDGAWLWDDLAYKNGPLFSPRAYKEQLLPYHKQVVDFFHAQGWPVILHSCGNITSLVPLLIEAEFDCLQALEVKAGVDLGFLVKEYGNHLCLQGGVDVRTFWAEDESEMEQEIRRKLAIGMASPGGYIFHSDHSIPPQVSFQRYARVVELVKRYGVYQ